MSTDHTLEGGEFKYTPPERPATLITATKEAIIDLVLQDYPDLIEKVRNLTREDIEPYVSTDLMED